jgi:hypothetical protein
MDERDVDAEFEAIIAGWDAGPPAVADDGPSTEEAPPPAPERPAAPTGGIVWRVHPSLLGPDEEPGQAASAAARSAEGAEDAEPEEHFVPEPVTLPPQEDLHFWGIIVGLVGGPLLLLWLIFVGGGAYASWWLFLAVALTVGGFGLLILRQPAHRDPDDPDNGARL